MQNRSLVALSLILASSALSPAHAKQCRGPYGSYLWNASLLPNEIPNSGGQVPTQSTPFEQKRAYYGALYRKSALDACRKNSQLRSPSSALKQKQRDVYAVQKIDDTSYICALDCYSPNFSDYGDGKIDSNDFSQCAVLIDAVVNLETEPMCDLIPNGPYKDLGPARGMLDGQKFGQTMRDAIIAKNQSQNAQGTIMSELANYPAYEPFGTLNRIAQSDMPYDDDAWVDDPFPPNPNGTYASSVQIDHIIPRVDVHGCACGPASYANAIPISASLNGAMSNNSQHPARKLILQTWTKTKWMLSSAQDDSGEAVDELDADPGAADDGEIGGCSAGGTGGVGGLVLVGLGLVAARRRGQRARWNAST